MKLDISSIDQESFNVYDNGERALIVPTKVKHVWNEDELHLRSLVVDKEGNVLSSGWSKFFNFGEFSKHDQQFIKALREGRVTFTHKMDGSLIIADRIEEEPHFRTRGSQNLGEFNDEVMALIKTKHPNLLDELKNNRDCDTYSYLFEYTSPKRRIVVEYDEPGLTFIGMMDKETLKPVAEPEVMEAWSERFDVPLVDQMNLSTEIDSLVSQVDAWKDSEGVVARFTNDEGELVLLKIKSEWYRSIHSLKYKMNGQRLRKLCFVEGIHTPEAFRDRLYDLGFDYEVYAHFEQEFTEYQSKRTESLGSLERLKEFVARQKETTSVKKDFVEAVKTVCGKGKEFPQSYFSVAMSLWDDKHEMAEIAVEAEALGEAVPLVRTWRLEPQEDLIARPTALRKQPEEEEGSTKKLAM